MLFSPVYIESHPCRSPRSSRVPYTLPSSVSRKSCSCHSYEDCRGVYQQFPFWNSLLSLVSLPFNYSDRAASRFFRSVHGACPDRVGTTYDSLKSFNCNTYGSPRKCCKQKTYVLAKPFRQRRWDVQTCGRSDVFPPVPLQPKAFGVTICKGARFLHGPGKQLRSPRCLRLRERTSGTVRVWSPLQVVPGSSVLRRVSGFVLTNPEQAGFRVVLANPEQLWTDQQGGSLYRIRGRPSYGRHRRGC